MRLAGVGEVAEILGVTKQRIHQLRQANRMPEPIAVLAATPVWDRDEIEKYAGTRRLHNGPCCPCMQRGHDGPCCPCADKHKQHCACVTSQRKQTYASVAETDENAHSRKSDNAEE